MAADGIPAVKYRRTVYLTWLSLTNFRSYEQVDVPLEPGVTAFIGPNGQGKTNLVEAVGYLATLGSHRVSSEAPLVKSDAQRGIIRAKAVKEDRQALVEVEIVPGGRNRAQLNRAPMAKTSDILGLIRCVVFAPEDLALVKGDPDTRRRFLDDLLVARSPRFAAVRSDYERIIKQRNALLKSAGASVRAGKGDVRTLDVWDDHLAEVGSTLLAARLQLVEQLNPLVAKAYHQLAVGSVPARMHYRSSMDDGPVDTGQDAALLRAQLLEAMAQLRPKELERGISLVGPHRDDVILNLGQHPAKGYASHGESWSYALSLKLAGYELLRDDHGDDPILILDDVFAELDTSRRECLTTIVGQAQQVLITAAVPHDVPDQLQGASFDVADGQVRRVC